MRNKRLISDSLFVLFVICLFGPTSVYGKLDHSLLDNTGKARAANAKEDSRPFSILHKEILDGKGDGNKYDIERIARRDDFIVNRLLVDFRPTALGEEHAIKNSERLYADVLFGGTVEGEAAKAMAALMGGMSLGWTPSSTGRDSGAGCGGQKTST